jgi:hypothetical protein
MTTVLVRQYEDSFVIHFGVTGQRINAYTLASTLTSLADAARIANSQINPGYEIEVLVEALGAGSFKAKIRTLYRGAENLFSSESLKVIVLGVIASFVYQHTLAPDSPVNVTIHTDEVIVEQDETKIVIPREVHEAMKLVEQNERFRKCLSGVATAVEADPSVRTVGFSASEGDEVPPLRIPRERFQVLAIERSTSSDETRDLVETTEIEILRAILERKKRRWEFSWGGIRIAAPVSDARFYDRFAAHEVMIAPGDRLRVRLKVKQRRSPDSGVFINESYEVLEVLAHLPRGAQQRLDSGS